MAIGDGVGRGGAEGLTRFGKAELAVSSEGVPRRRSRTRLRLVGAAWRAAAVGGGVAAGDVRGEAVPMPALFRRRSRTRSVGGEPGGCGDVLCVCGGVGGSGWDQHDGVRAVLGWDVCGSSINRLHTVRCWLRR